MAASVSTPRAGITLLQVMTLSLLPLICLMDTRGSASTVVPCNIYNSSQHGGLSADCTHRNLTRVPSNLPSDIVFLDISDNEFEVLENFAFKRFSKLKHLIAARNQLKLLEVKTFHGCVSLQTLDMEFNQLDYNNLTFQTGVFERLTNLITLHIEGNLNTDMGSYPDDLFKPLRNVENLYIDTFHNTVFDKQFSFLQHLRVLQLGPNCNTLQLFNNTFEAFKNSKLESLYLYGCSFKDIELDTFKPLIFLRHLIMRFTRPLGIRKAFLSLHGLQHRSMETIHFHTVLPSLSISAEEKLQATKLDSQVLQYLGNICVKQLIVVDCEVFLMDVPSLMATTFSKCIEHIDVQRNRFQAYDQTYVATVLTFVHLRYLDISFSSNDKRLSFCEDTTKSRFGVSSGRFNFKRSSSLPVIIYLPRNLSLVNICGISTNLGHMITPDVKFVNGEEVNVINMSFVGLTDVSIEISGLENLHTLDFSHNSDLNIEPSFLDAFPNIRTLYLGGRSLKDNYLMEHGKRLFQHLERLSVLDMSHNDLNILPRDILKSNSQIKVINLAGNKFQTFPIDTKSTPSLSTLDLSDNSLSELDAATTAALDKLVDRDSKKGLSLMLENNLMFCGCSSQRFILWLFETPVQLDNGGNYKCISENGSVTTTRDIYNRFEQEWRSCVGPFWLFLAIIGLIMQATTILCIILVIKFKSRIICFFLRIFGAPLRLPHCRDFPYDAFICYTQSAEQFVWYDMVRNLEEERNLRLYLRDREILPGDEMVDGIMQGIMESWKTVFVLTQNVDEDQWMTFAVKAGVYNITDLRTDRVLVLVHSEYDQQIPDPILRVIDEDCIFRYSPQTTDRDPVWNDLHNAIIGHEY
ncbi:toll-like receptor 4 [Gigantopelta aegis]|uniref:toll-like receptor 4 n=1 Tax=Gigantopelta aegis TaxID=1735272 RepID=UPI001B88DCD2|nr:toll-like receptor 4 [Gigantopelta aegis]